MIMNDKDAKNDTKILNAVRPGIVDVWNAFMLDGATYAEHDIPNCPTTANKIPSQLISWSKAKQLHKRFISSNKNYHINAFIHFYIDDSKFDIYNDGNDYIDCKFSVGDVLEVNLKKCTVLKVLDEMLYVQFNEEKKFCKKWIWTDSSLKLVTLYNRKK